MAAVPPTVVITFKDMPNDESLRRSLEARCHEFAEEFPETTRFEITVSPDGNGHNALGHVTGDRTEVTSHADAIEAGHAADRLLDKLIRQLRRVHEKRVFVRRREAQQAQLKRRT
ncbi:MAG: HPF/RaiA family ribosome-associated protein [Deltaproteobacteria bacterium]|nr:MAG: HPF/RaiA family ribosome-associated protein [Deltaproteobacteria bacterium]